MNEEDAVALRAFRATIDDAHAAGLECWITLCPNLASPPDIAVKPWPQRNPHGVWKRVRLDDPQAKEAFLAHRAALLRILNNADGYVTIDGDPGGYAGAKPEDWLKVFLSDRAAIDRYGVAPRRQQMIPWVWCGWGTSGVWREPIEGYVRQSMELLGTAMPEPWEMLPGRSYRDEGYANGRVNIALADKLGLMSRSTILCYEAIECEPSAPAAVLQLDIIRRVLRREAGYARTARGVMSNAQQPVMVLPNMYLFARGSWDLNYLERTDEEVLADCADLLGGPREVLVAAWSCLRLGLDRLPASLPSQLRAAKLTTLAGRSIPGGADRYLDILARQVESHRDLLQAVHEPAHSDAEAAERVVAATAALVGWWKVHGYVFHASGDEPFRWKYVLASEVDLLKRWCTANVRNTGEVARQAAQRLESQGVLPAPVSQQCMADLLGQNGDKPDIGTGGLQPTATPLSK